MDVKIKKFGKFKLFVCDDKPLARGGMAELFLSCSGSGVKDATKFMIIKRILLAHSHNKEFNTMFKTEGKIAVNLNHRNICSIYEFGIEKDQYFICMEYLSGRNLRQLVKKLRSQKKVMEPAVCAYIIREVCNGLEYAHNCTDNITGHPLNIIHRDISPQNVMIGFSGDIKLIDFGIAKISDSESTRAGVLKGKFEYMAPEQVRGKELDRKADIFSTGNVLWELLADKKLFSGKNELQILKKIKECRIPELKTLNTNLPSRLVEIVNKALNVNKYLRYKTAGEMGNALSVFLNKFYPNFTQSDFISFIKEVYSEEIWNERDFLKKCGQVLNSNSSYHQSGGISKPASDSQIVSTFLGYQKSLEESEAEEEWGQTESYITLENQGITKDTSPSELNTLTQTEGSKIKTDLFKTKKTDVSKTKTNIPQTKTDVPRTKTEALKTKTDVPWTKTEALTKGLKTDVSRTKTEALKTEITKTEFQDETLQKTPTSKQTQSTLSVRMGTSSKPITLSGHETTAKLLFQPNEKKPILHAQRLRRKRKVQKRKHIKRAVALCSFILAVGAVSFYWDTEQMIQVRKGMLNFAQKMGSLASSDTSPLDPDSPSSAKDSSSERDVSSVVPSKKANPSPSSKNPSPSSKPVAEERSVFITTQPSGAQIYVNSRNLNLLTPVMMALPNKRFKLTLKRPGYKDKTVVLKPTLVKHRLNFSLEKSQKARTNDSTIIIQ